MDEPEGSQHHGEIEEKQDREYNVLAAPTEDTASVSLESEIELQSKEGRNSLSWDSRWRITNLLQYAKKTPGALDTSKALPPRSQRATVSAPALLVPGSQSSEATRPLAARIRTIFNSDDAACAITACPRFLALGTASGSLLLATHDGSAFREFPAHTYRVNQIVIDSSHEFIASISADGGLGLFSYSNPEFRKVYALGRPLCAVAFDPKFTEFPRLVVGGASGDLYLLAFPRGLLSTAKVSFATASSSSWAPLSWLWKPASPIALEKPPGSKLERSTSAYSESGLQTASATKTVNQQLSTSNVLSQAQKGTPDTKSYEPITTLVAKDVGSIISASWHEDIIIYASELWIEVLQISKGARGSTPVPIPLCKLSVPVKSGRPEQFRCIFGWRDANTVAISWYNSLQLLQLFGDPGSRKPGAKIIFKGNLEFIAHGMHLCASSITLLGLVPNSSLSTVSICAEDKVAYNVEIVECSSQSPYKIRHHENIPAAPINEQFTGFQNTALCGTTTRDSNTVSTFSIYEPPLLFLLTQSSVWSLHSRSTAEQIQWLIDAEQEEKAFQCANRALSKPGSELPNHLQPSELGLVLLERLFASCRFQRAASFCPLVLGASNAKPLSTEVKSAASWEIWIKRFIDYKELKHLARYVPIPKHRNLHSLPERVYHDILLYFLNQDTRDSTVFRYLVYKWDAQINASQKLMDNLDIVLGIKKDYSESDIPPCDLCDFAEAGLKLYSYDTKQYHILYCHMLLNQVEQCLMLAERHPSAMEKVASCKAKQWVEMCLKNCGNELMRAVESPEMLLLCNANGAFSNSLQFETGCDEKIALVYFYAKARHRGSKIFKKAEIFSPKDKAKQSQVSILLLRLLAKHLPTQVGAALRMQNAGYTLTEALKVCQEYNLHLESAHVMGRMGRYQDAIETLLNSVQDIAMAVSFAMDQNDKSVWLHLFSCAAKRPECWPYLIEQAAEPSSMVSATMVLAGIPSDTKISRKLNSALRNLLRTRRLSLDQQSSILKLLSQETNERLSRFASESLRGKHTPWPQ